MKATASEVIARLAGRTLATAESLTGGMIGSALTAVPGASEVYLGGVVSYVNRIKEQLLDVPGTLLAQYGAVSAPVAAAMAQEARRLLCADFALSVTGLAGPGGDEFGHEVGTVFIGLADAQGTRVEEFHFTGDRAAVRQKTVAAALALILEAL